MPNPADTRAGAHARPTIAGGGLLAVLASLLLVACASTPATDASNQSAKPPPPVLRQLAGALPGTYVSIGGSDRPLQTLSIKLRSGDTPSGLGLLMIQADRDGSDRRRYGLRLEPSDAPNRLDGSFAILDEHGQARRRCAMRFHVTSQGLIGETDPQTCRFGEGDDAVGVLKEIAIQGRRITVADQLVDPESGSALGDDQMIRFLPAVGFSGWLGVREGDDWRVAREFELRVGERVEPLDAADMSLGLVVTLHYDRMETRDAETLLRLTVTDVESGDIVAESWAEPGSASIGLALSDLQVGLARPD